MENVKTISIAVSEQLKNAAKVGKSLDVIGHTYIQERLLYRLSVSAYQERFLLKGDHLLATLTNGLVKPSEVIYLSAKQITKDIIMLQHVFKEICAIKVPADGVEFLVDELEITDLKEEVHIEIPAILGEMKLYIEIKVSYRDHHILTPKSVVLPTLLEMESSVLLGYSTEVMIAEKFEVMISLVEVDNRMKDFYDVYLLLNTQSIEGRVLQEVVLEIFDRRRTRLERELPILSEKFYLDSQRNEQWLAFSAQQGLSFETVIKRLQKGLTPIYNAIVNEDEFFGNWDCELQGWK